MDAYFNLFKAFLHISRQNCLFFTQATYIDKPSDKRTMIKAKTKLTSEGKHIGEKNQIKKKEAKCV